MTTTELTVDVAAELGQRFSDLSNFEVLEHVNHVCNTLIRENDLRSLAIIRAYETADAELGLQLAESLGIK